MHGLIRLGCLGLIAGVCATAAATEIYQWRDADGVIHSSDSPPANQKYEVRRIDDKNRTVMMEGAPEAGKAPAENPQCTTARNNLQLLNSDASIQQEANGDGKPGRVLSDAERAAQKTLAEAAVKAYCLPASANAEPVN